VVKKTADMVSRSHFNRLRDMNCFCSPHNQRKIRNYVLLFLGCVLFFSSLSLRKAHSAKEDNVYEQRIPSSLLIMDSLKESYAIIVEKNTQKLSLYGSRGSSIELIKSFSCSTGKNGGDKKKSGDRKTPEGIYFFTRVYEDEELDSRYGVKAFVLDYPNAFDQLQKKGGKGIWLHGTDRTLVPNDSKGCIALENQDILELSRYITLYCTPIIITETIEYLTKEESKLRKKQLESFVSQWHHSWEKKDLSRYVSFYAQDFTSQGMNWSQWKDYKDRINKKNNEIDIAIEGVQGFSQNGYDVVMFLQDYRSSSFESEGVKRLYLRAEGEDLKIVRERWNSLRGGYLALDRKATTSVAKFASRITQEDEIEAVEAFVEQWKTWWERKEFEGYMSCYSVDFQNGDFDRKGWEAHKRALNQKYKTIEVGITNTKVALDKEGQSAKVSFIQHYQSDRYSDAGTKTLLLKQEAGKWRIVSELWVSL
jgi:murein L,D-transpeptidase YafK